MKDALPTTMKRHHSTVALMTLTTLTSGLALLPAVLYAQEPLAPRPQAGTLLTSQELLALTPQAFLPLTPQAGLPLTLQGFAPLTPQTGTLLTFQTAAPPTPQAVRPQTSQAVPPPPQASRRFGAINISHARSDDFQNGILHLEGEVLIRYTDPQSSVPTKIEADTVDYNLATGEVKARGNFTDALHPVLFRLTREDAVFTGREMTISVQDGNGIVTNGDIRTDYYHLTGERIELRDKVYLITHGSFTSCIHRRPDYHITAHDILFVPDKEVKAHNITFFAGPTRLFTLPYYSRDLNSGLAQQVPFAPYYNKNDGPGIHYQSSPLSHPDSVLHLDIYGNFKREPTGYIAYQQDILPTADVHPPSSIIPSLAYPLRGVVEEMTPPTYQEYAENSYPEPLARRVVFYAVGQNQQFIYNRRYTDLGVSRFPEIGVRLLNLLDSTHPENPGDSSAELNQAPLTAPHGVGFASHIRPVLDVSTALGGIEEFPDKAIAGRLATRISLASTPFLIGTRLSARAGVTDWLNYYSTGTAYTLFSPEGELNYMMTRTSSLNAGYSFFTDAGDTPFLFDRRDVRQELRLGYRVSGPIGFGYLTKLDIGRSRFYDSELALTRNFDCMQIGLSYRLRSQSIGIIFSLTAAPRRARTQPQ